MKKLSFLTLALLAVLAGCTKEQEPASNGELPSAEEKVYMAFRLTTVETRSSTEADGTSDADPDTEIGAPIENTIQSIDVVIVNPDDNSVVALSENVSNLTATAQTYVATFDSKSFLQNYVAGKDYKVYIYVNADLTFGIDATYSVDADDLRSTIAKDNGFLMTNADQDNNLTITDLKSHTVSSNPLDLGMINVERAVARFDYKAYNADNIYPILKDDSDNTLVQIQLTDAALLNMSKSFYHFRRVSPTGTNTDWVVGGKETKTNYVVDTDYAQKATIYSMSSDALATFQRSNYLYPYSPDNAMTSYSWTKLSAITSGRADEWKGADGTDGYYFWRYAIENTIPSDGTEGDEQGNSNQKHAVTTGVAFLGEIQATEALKTSNETLYNEITAGTEKLYVFQNVLYGSWSTMKAKAFEEGSSLYALQGAINKIEAITVPTEADYAAAGFKSYTPTDKKYTTVYYYWNQHNDNGDKVKMGPMEFCVVRNNVYKLAVTKISAYGHPTNPTDPDPDPEEPDDPDEDLNYYFTVSVKVLPWAVRLNNIEF